LDSDRLAEIALELNDRAKANGDGPAGNYRMIVVVSRPTGCT
jgi:hypothetical protein